MSKDLVTWLRAQIEARKALAEAARADMPPGGDRWVAGEAEHNAGGANVYDGEGRSVAVDREGEGATSRPIAEHMATNDPRDTIARCEAELRILDDMVPILNDLDDIAESEGQAARRPGRPSEYMTGGREPSAHLLRLLVYGYRHRPRYQEEWKPDLQL